jgi:hypothetical protein
MGCHDERAALIKALRELLDRLCSPDLTLGEAKDLRAQLLDLLDQSERKLERGRTASPSSTGIPRRSVSNDESHS